MGKYLKFLVLFVVLTTLYGCKKQFQNAAIERCDFVIDSINNDETKEDQSMIAHKRQPSKVRYKKETLICNNDTAFIQIFNCHWTAYTGEPADKLCFFALCKDKDGNVFELCKPIAWLERVQVNSYVSRLNEQKAIVDAIYKACLIAGVEKEL